PRNAAISVTFTRDADPASLTVNTSDNSCSSGTLQVSKDSDNFATGTCVPMAAQPTDSGNHQTFTIHPAAPLGGGASATDYRVRVKTAVRDGDLVTGLP